MPTTTDSLHALTLHDLRLLSLLLAERSVSRKVSNPQTPELKQLLSSLHD